MRRCSDVHMCFTHIRFDKSSYQIRTQCAALRPQLGRGALNQPSIFFFEPFVEVVGVVVELVVEVVL